MKVSLEELAREANSTIGIGTAWLSVIKQAVKIKCKKMPPRDFGYQEWNEDAFEDVVQDIVEKRLLKKGGVQYVLAEATSAAHAQAAIFRLVQLGLADLREPSVVDNIYDNLTRRLLEMGHVIDPVTKSHQSDGPVDEMALELKVKQILLDQPRYPNRGTQRESAIFNPASFDEIIEKLLGEVKPLSSQILRNGVKKALTHLIRAEYYIDDANGLSDEKPDASSVENEATNRDYEFGAHILKRMSQESEKVFTALAYGVKSDSDLALALGLKARQTAKKWHEEMKRELLESFDEFEVPVESQMDVVLAMKELLGIGDSKHEMNWIKNE